MLSQFHPRTPPKNFNLLYLQSNEVYFLTLKVSMLTDSQSQQVPGKLHLCSRSIIFQHPNIDKPLIRMKFSCGVLLRMLKNVDVKKLYKLVSVKKSQGEIKNMFGKGAAFVSDVLQKEEIESNKKANKIAQQSLINRLFQPMKKKSQQPQQKITNSLFIRVSKLLVIYRKPISPYITQKVSHTYMKMDQNLIFQLSKSSNKLKILRFLKIYDQIIKCTDQDRLIQSIVTATIDQSTEQLLQLYQNQSQNSKITTQDIIRCKRIKIEGSEYGQLVFLKDICKYYPLVNCPDFQNIEFTYQEIKYMQRYRYMFEDKGLEIWLYNCQYSILFCFTDTAAREFVYKGLLDRATKILRVDIQQISDKWANGEISNIQYINYLNVFGNRSHNDLSQYPVFPWIFHSYDGDYDLKNAEMFRDLTKPIGAINKHRLRKLKDLYEIQSKDKTVTHPPHLYSTHYSTPGYVAYYLLRRIPQFIVRLQNGVFNPSDRIFRCVESAYYSSMNSAADFKELTPQFYSSSCDFLVNSQKLEMGSTPEGEVIDDVLLPKWAKSAQDFLLKSRAAFQSDFVSSHLHQWIDLIFGFKQSGTHAITYDNVYYFLTYEQNVNFDRPMSRAEKAALQVQVSQFGQTSPKIFKVQHISRKTRIIHLDLALAGQDKKLTSAKLVTLSEQNERLQEKLQRQKHRFNKKLTQKQQLLIQSNRDKKKQLQKLREALCIDQESLKRFNFKSSFNNEKEKDTYIRQIEEMIRQRERKNAQMATIITGLKRQINQEDHSVDSQVQDIPQGKDFFYDGS